MLRYGTGMTENTADFAYRTRPGSLWLSVFALAGLTLLSAVVWTIAPVFALVLLVPSVLICLYQMIASPVYGISLNAARLHVRSDAPDLEVPLAEIARLDLSGADAMVHLRDGATLPLPGAVLPRDRSALIAAAHGHGLATVAPQTRPQTQPDAA